MGDHPKPSDDAAWTEVERNFFAAAPPEEPQPLEEASCFDDRPAPPPQRPRREIIAWLRPSLAGAWRRATFVLGAAGLHLQRAWRRTVLVVGAAGVGARRTARAGAAGLIAALSILRVDRRRVVFASVGAIMAAGFIAGVVAFREGALTKSAAPTVAEAAPAAIANAQAAPRPNVRSSAEVQAPRADGSSRRPRAHRRSVPAAASAQRPQESAFVDRETYWAREARPGADRASRPLFSR